MWLSVCPYLPNIHNVYIAKCQKLQSLKWWFELPPEESDRNFQGACFLIGIFSRAVTIVIFCKEWFLFRYFQDFRANAEKARREVDGQMFKGRPLRVRFAPQSTAIKVKNLNQFVTNELLEWAFQVFGEVIGLCVFLFF